MKLDALDVKIIGLLQEDARLSFRDIAQRLGSTTPTVSARIKALEDIGLLQGYRAQLDHSVLGGKSYIVTLTVSPSAARTTLDDLRALRGVYRVHLLAGGKLVLHIHTRPHDRGLPEIHDAFAKLPGLITYDASEVIASHEHSPTQPLAEDVEVACHQCHGPIHGEPVRGRFGERTHVFCCKQCLGDFRARFETHVKEAGQREPASDSRAAHRH